MSLKLRPAYRNGYFIGFCYMQFNEHSQSLQAVTPAYEYRRLVTEWQGIHAECVQEALEAAVSPAT